MAADEPYPHTDSGIDAPASDAETITPNDSSDVAEITRAVYIGGTGDVAVVMKGGETVTFSAVPAGTLLPIRVSRVKATGTTATNIVGLW